MLIGEIPKFSDGHMPKNHICGSWTEMPPRILDFDSYSNLNNVTVQATLSQLMACGFH